ncbi:MAG TPA: circularly permuted type 2 ATP-grasp protein [Gemmatimonadales bacterium]|nr:circularly permuted type 2 ATP-grasp protein [Gemmatimonadales bacterium]
MSITRAPEPRTASAGMFDHYEPVEPAYDEAFAAPGKPRGAMASTIACFESMGLADVRKRKRLADQAFRDLGVTFLVHGDARGVERTLPFDPIPRVITASDWALLERGLEQRVRALNAFLGDVYGQQRILKDGRVPRDVVLGSGGFLAAVHGVRPRGGVYIHVAGIDVIRRPDGEFAVLEDNLRTPSGVSYVLENRKVMKRLFPQALSRNDVRPVDEYPARLREALSSLVPGGSARGVVLTPGPYNSAYFEHCFLARQMGCGLVQGSDLAVRSDGVFMRTTHGLAQVDVIYRRIDDAFLDPETFRADSLIGVPGLVRAYAAGTVVVANGIGNGVADDKSVYPFVPEMVRFYLDETPLLRQVETFRCGTPRDRDYVLANLASLVVKAVGGAGGYGMLVGPAATRKERSAFADRIRANGAEYIAQPLIELATCPTLLPARVAPRRVDLRPYVVTGRSSWVLPGGLTRVAMRNGSYVVNSSQGGGSKDTWVLADSAA